MYPCKLALVFEREIQPHEMVKSLCKSVAALHIKREMDNKNLYIPYCI